VVLSRQDDYDPKSEVVGSGNKDDVLLCKSLEVFVQLCLSRVLPANIWLGPCSLSLFVYKLHISLFQYYPSKTINYLLALITVVSK